MYKIFQLSRSFTPEAKYDRTHTEPTWVSPDPGSGILVECLPYMEMHERAYAEV